MLVLFVLLAVVAVIGFIVLPLVAALAYTGVLVWVAYLLQLLFYREDSVSKALGEKHSDGGT